MSLQQYNSRLQSDLEITNEAHKRLETEKATIVENLSNVRGHNKALQDQLASLKVSCFVWLLILMLEIFPTISIFYNISNQVKCRFPSSVALGIEREMSNWFTLVLWTCFVALLWIVVAVTSSFMCALEISTCIKLFWVGMAQVNFLWRAVKC